jgi:hypothetical protein
MLQAIVQSHEALSNFLSLFRDAFQNRPQYRHFQAYVIGLIIYLGSRNLAGLEPSGARRQEPMQSVSLYGRDGLG